jgi:hypothetical protein
MSRISLEDLDYELVKAHILSPEASPLNDQQQKMMSRIMSAARVLDKNPVIKNAVALHTAKYPEIGRSRAYLDVQLARKLFNTIHKFDYEFWQTWLINDIVANITAARISSDPASRRVIAMEHANLIKAIGEKPEIQSDPRLNEKHEFYILINTSAGEYKVDYNKLRELPPATLQEFYKVLMTTHELTDDEALAQMET